MQYICIVCSKKITDSKMEIIIKKPKMPNHLIIDLNQTLYKKSIQLRISISGFGLDKIFHCLGIRKPNYFFHFAF